MRRLTRVVALLTLSILLGPGVGGAPSAADPVRLTDVTVDQGNSTLTVRISTSSAARYRTMLIDSPPRLVIDLADTLYAWRGRKPLRPNVEPLREVRGSQWRPDVSRVVVEMTHRIPYRIEEAPDGLAVVFEASRAEAGPAKAPTPSVAAPPAQAAPAPTAPLRPPKTEPTPQAVGAGTTVKPAAAEPPVRLAEARTGPAPGAQSPIPNGSRLISMDFKDADIINLLRILAAEGGRNIVAGEDVKGKVSVSLRNVTWEQALDTILEVRGLRKIEKDNVIRVVSVDQLAREREAQARAEEAKRKAEIEVRTKEVEAQLKEAELQAKRQAAELARAEAAARGPLREETVRLSYADPEEVAKTLQGILGIPPEGTVPVPTAGIGAPPSVPAGPPLIAEPPFSQLYGAAAQGRAPTLVSVSQDVLAKGITIRAHRPTNTIFIRHYASDLERIKKLIRDQLDVPLPQVKIEARMEILDRNALEAIGIQWGGAAAGTAGRTTVIGQGFSPRTGTGTGTTLTPGNPNLGLSQLLPVSGLTGLPIGGNLVNLPFAALPNSAAAIPAANLAFGIIGTNFNINLALQALATQGKTRTLARPEIITVENSKAQVSLGEEIPYATVSSAGTQIQFKEALLKLEVTPTVIREKIGSQEITKIKMLVVVENNSRGDTVDLGTSGAPPAINRRKAETQVLINEGERLVVGGVTTSVQQDTVRKVPLLGDIPLLGWLFKHRENFETGRELVVFVTPSILRSEGAPAARTPPRR